MWKRTVLIASLIAVPVAVWASVNGAIYTSVSDGTAVNANIYAEKADVYLNGGPQNERSAGLSPDGNYYFQVTDPSGAVLLSTDDITCRVVVVAGGRIAGVPTDAASGYGNPGCYHAAGSFNAASKTRPVQLMPFANTPNPGGEYKVWLTPVASYQTACAPNHGSYGFCDAESKTDNFKVRSSAPAAARVTVCVFNDLAADGVQATSDPMLAHWPVSATGVDGGTVSAQTDDNGCTTFTYSGFKDANASQVITLTQGTFGPDWFATAPTTCGDLANCQVANGVTTIVLRPGDEIAAPNFGDSNPYCQTGCAANTLVLTANTYPSLTRTFTWEIAKSVDRTRIASAESRATFNYTVSVSHDAGVDSEWRTTGTIRVSNPTGAPISALSVSALAETGACSVVGGDSITIPAGSHLDLPYACTYTAAPAASDVKVLADWNAGHEASETRADFATAAVKFVDDQVTVTDSMAGSLGTLTRESASPAVFTYASDIAGQAGTCVTADNVATFTTNATDTRRSASQSVELCVGANLSMTTTATASFASRIEKTVDRTMVQQAGGSAPFAYTVRVFEQDWAVSGEMRITNPNDWQAVTLAATQTIDGAACALSGGDVTIGAGDTVTVPFTCTFAAAPAASGATSATIAWDAAAFFTPSGSASQSAGFAFAPLTVTDTFDGAVSTLGVIATPASTTSYTYTRTVLNATGGACRVYSNVAAIAGTSQSASATVTICNQTTGAHTIGFWQNKNGQAVITTGIAPGGVCASGSWLRQFAPFQDLSATASCKTVAAYATTVIKAANAAGASMNAMLKAQMLATALSVYFSDASLGGNQIAAATAVGGVNIDLGAAKAAFGGAASLTVIDLLRFQNGVANAGGTVWYSNIKVTQALAKNIFDAINNEIARIMPDAR